MLEGDGSNTIRTAAFNESTAATSIDWWSDPALAKQQPLMQLARNDCKDLNLSSNECWDYNHKTLDQQWQFRNMSPNARHDYEGMSRDEQWTHDHLPSRDQDDYRRMTPSERWDFDHGK
jgi:hypothetical protein